MSGLDGDAGQRQRDSCKDVDDDLLADRGDLAVALRPLAEYNVAAQKASDEGVVGTCIGTLKVSFGLLPSAKYKVAHAFLAGVRPPVFQREQSQFVYRRKSGQVSGVLFGSSQY